METNQLSFPDAFSTLAQLVGGYCVPRGLHVVAHLGIADHLDDTARTATELAAAVGVHPEALGRLLRLLSAHGVFTAEGDAFRHSPVSRLLRSDHPQSMRAFAQLFGLRVFWQIFERFDFSLKTNQPATGEVVPEGLWAYFAEHPEESKIFNAAMASKAIGHVAGVLAAYDFSGFRKIGDIGGGRGHLLKGILDATPRAEGVLFDLPNVVADATEIVSDRLKVQAGDFFKDALPTCDAYILMEIIHDWADEEALAILQSVRRSAPPQARLLLMEQPISPEPGPHWSKMLDLYMLTLLGGRQRSRQEYENMLKQAGFRLEREIPTFADIVILEAVCD